MRVAGKTPILVDDVIAGGSIVNQARALAEAGAKPCYIAVTHGVLVGESLERLSDPCIQEVIVTNTVPVPDEKRVRLPKLTVLSIAPLLAKVIHNIHHCESVSRVFKEYEIDFPV
ncbi:MAG: hypothetical protein KatS3mg115_2013 [Candidatus Poribacteria bacterium]|nr:MAG: hypothetical protein KatS3mg115_2013 [Candidatus Poribacteria bacterium]